MTALQSAETAQSLTAAYPTLGPQMRKAARYLLDNPEDVAFRSLRDVAARAGVGPATLSRLARAAHYESYNALQDSVRRDLSQAWTFAERVTRMQAQKQERLDRLAEHVAATTHNIEALGFGAARTQFEAATRHLLEARQVLVVGAMGGFAQAYFAHYMASLALSGWSLMRSHDGSFADALYDLDGRDVVLVFGFLPYANSSVHVAKTARNHGAKVIAITDVASSPLARVADVTICVSTAGANYFPSAAAAIAATEILLAEVIGRSGPQAVKKLKHLDKIRYDLGEYWREPGETGA